MTVSCATSPNFSKRAIRVIDRDFTLPAGVTSWKTLLGFAIDPEPSPFFYPAQWEQGLSDVFTLVWMPLPLEARLRLIKTEEFTLSLGAAFLGQIQSRNRNFDWRPTMQVLGRWKTGRDWALELEALSVVEVTRDPFGNPGWLGLVRVSPWWQALDRLGVSAGIGAQVESGAIRSRYVGGLPGGSVGAESEQGLRRHLPLFFAMEAVPWDSWALRAEGWSYGLAEETRFLSASCFLSVIHTW